MEDHSEIISCKKQEKTALTDIRYAKIIVSE
jgi:hypothetical protein